MKPLEKLMADEPIDPHEEATRLTALFAQIKRCVASLPGIQFHHLAPGEIGKFGRIEWNAWLYVTTEDRVFPMRVAIEAGRHSQFRMRIHPDMEKPTDVTIITALRDIMRDQMTGVDSMFVRMRYWTEKREEPVRRARLAS